MAEREIPIEIRRTANSPTEEGSQVLERSAGAGANQASSEAPEELGREYWRDRALRLQADMENYRKRQRRMVEGQILADRARVLAALLEIGDDLERVLSADPADEQSLRQGIALTQRKLKRLLEQEEVEEIAALGRPFDPAWHEAVGSRPHQRLGTAPNTVVEVVQKGYRLKDRLLRPARVIVAT